MSSSTLAHAATPPLPADKDTTPAGPNYFAAHDFPVVLPQVPETRPELPANSLILSATEALEEIKRTLPVGIELHRSYHYVFPLGKQKKLDLLVLKLHCPDELESKLNNWRASIADQLDSVSILVRRVRGTQGVLNNLRNTFRGQDRITSEDRPTVDTMIESLCGKLPSLVIDKSHRIVRREDLTEVPWIAPDRPGVRDIEDLIHAERKPNGTVVWRTAIVDATDYVTAGSEIDRYALRVGSTLYGRHRTVPTLGPELAHNLVSFVEGEERPAWVVEGILKPISTTSNGKRASTRYELSHRIRRALVKNHRNIDPQQVPPLQGDSAFGRSLSACAEAARILRHVRASKPTPIRVDDAGGPLTTVTAELMIESKRLLTEFLSTRAPMIYRVHHRPSKQTKLQFHKALNALKIPNSVENFDSPSEFAGILRTLESRRDSASQALLNDLLDTFLLRTLYSVDNYGHYGLRFDEFAEWKPRDASGLTNQLQADAAWLGLEPLSRDDILARTNILNEKRWRRDERTYALCFLEMLSHKISLEGTVAVGTVSDVSGDTVYVDTPGFSKWGILEGVANDSALTIGDPITAILGGFDLYHARFLFELDTEAALKFS